MVLTDEFSSDENKLDVLAAPSHVTLIETHLTLFVVVMIF